MDLRGQIKHRKIGVLYNTKSEWTFPIPETLRRQTARQTGRVDAWWLTSWRWCALAASIWVTQVHDVDGRLGRVAIFNALGIIEGSCLEVHAA